MKTWDNESCPSKALIRPELFTTENRFKKRTAKTFMCNPADLCLCVKEAFKQGIIDTDTKILAIERGPKAGDTHPEYGWEMCPDEAREQKERIIKSIYKELKILGFAEENITIWDGDIVDLTANEMRRLGFGRIDYAYLDTCSCLSKAFITWYRRHMNKVINFKSTLAFTFMISRDVKAWENYPINDRERMYYFCGLGNISTLDRDIDKLFAANKVSKLIQDNTKFDNVVTYGRTYKEPGKSQPMLTFKINFGWKQKNFTGSMDTLNLGYKNRTGYFLKMN